MGLPSRKPDHARHRIDQDRQHDSGKAPPHLRPGRGWGLVAGLILWLLTGTWALADSVRIATYNTELFRDGPGLLLRDIARGKDAQVRAVIAEIDALNPDILVLQGFDWDYDGRALAALSEALVAPYPHRFAAKPNTGIATGVDLDGDGLRYGPRDAFGYGTFTGQGGMAVLSRYPIREAGVQDFTTRLWRDLPDANMPTRNRAPFPSEAAHAIQRLSSVAHWAIPIDVPELGQITLLTWHGSTPVFDGPEDRNGKRGGDEARFWQHYLDGAFGPPGPNPILAGQSNIDPNKGEGLRGVMQSLLDEARLQTPEGTAQPTANWPQTGPMRASYILPSNALTVTASGVTAPNPEASRHRIVWVDITP